MKKNPNVFIIYHKIGYGGANKMISFVANTLVKHGCTVSIYTYRANVKPEYFLDDRIQLYLEEKHSGSSWTDRVHQLGKSIKLIKSSKSNVVLSFMSTSNLYAVLSTRILKVPTIISERGYPAIEKSLVSKVKRWIIQFSEGAVFQTEGAQKFYSKKLQARSLIIPNPVPKPEIAIKKWEERKNEIAFVSRFEIKQKRHDIMLQAFRRVINLYPEYKLSFYGDGDDLEAVKKEALELGLEKNVVFHGKKNNILELLNDTKFFALASDYEGIPNALIEAMSMGLACVSTDCKPGGARLLINNNVNGILTPVGDSEALARSLIYLIENQKNAEKMAYKAQEIVEVFSQKDIEQKWVNYVKKVSNSTLD